MQDLLNLIRWMLLGLFRSKTSLEAEILALRYSKTRIKRSKDVRAGRLGALRRSTFNWCRSAITPPSSELLDRKRSRRIHLSRLKISSTRRSSPDSGAQAKRMEFAVGTAGSTITCRSSREPVDWLLLAEPVRRRVGYCSMYDLRAAAVLG